MTDRPENPPAFPWDEMVEVGAYQEPSLSSIIHGYYAAHFSSVKADSHTDEYIAALNAMLAERAKADPQ